MDAKDIVVLCLVSFIVLASWVYVYLHPDPATYGLAVGGTGAIGGILHFLWIRDDKQPDRRGDNAGPQA